MRVGYGLLLAFTAGCGGSTPSGSNPPPAPPPPPPAEPGTTSVAIADFAFSSSAVLIKVGDTVRWTNNGPSGHSVVADNGSFNSGALAGPTPGDPYGGGGSTGGVFSRVFTSAGTIAYHCGVHPAMTGTVTVTN